ncbi:hypothetical protein MG290_07685 [Flavobacterium sp. CBA20B-1]|uniref:hypothetical protein n=1 Tax=unclassified Flavobacterium TaxID=196869 RepID=UPI002224D2B0|nr:MULTISPECIES: hypothetical protein [unclassified Flavobacterium]WCM40859.1 hypothetical protein MG290_07685 [Flavobacterium sp. CBA20B-1]
MSTGNVRTPDFYTHIFYLTHEVKSYSVFTHNFIKSSNIQLLTETLRIEVYRGKSNAKGIETYLRLRTSTNWQTCEMVTGLRPTKNRNVFYGDRKVNGKRNLLIFEYLDNDKALKIDVYRAFYPNTPKILQDILKRNYNA